MNQLISYAQNFEDVMLWRALASVDAGNYIDIGAQSALVDSVSRIFYEHGWHGVHIDAMAVYAEELRRERPGDMVIQAAVAATGGTMRFFGIAETGLSTTQEDIATKHREAGFEVVETVVPAITLDDVLGQLDDRVIHWMKIDVEGGEREVLAGWRVSTLRPWILVIESTVPLTGDEVFEDWEHLVVDKGYRFVYFDGLNRYYVSAEHAELAESFSVPPNLFDDFALSTTSSTPFRREFSRELAVMSSMHGEVAAELSVLRGDFTTAQLRVGELEAMLKRSQAEGEQQAHQLGTVLKNAAFLQSEFESVRVKFREQAELAHRWWVTAEGMRAELAQIHASNSWRLTGVLRYIRRRFGPRRVAGTVIRLIKRPAFTLMLRASTWPGVRKTAFAILAVSPGFRERLRQALVRAAAPAWGGADTAPATSAVPIRRPRGAGTLGLRASRVLGDLDRAIKTSKGP